MIYLHYQLKFLYINLLSNFVCNRRHLKIVLILNHTEAHGSTVVAERIRQYIENMTTTFEDNSLSVTVSVGAASLVEEDDMTTLFSRADKALYQAKHEGRNRVVMIKG